jgi:hypothetical protein
MAPTFHLIIAKEKAVAALEGIRSSGEPRVFVMGEITSMLSYHEEHGRVVKFVVYGFV